VTTEAATAEHIRDYIQRSFSTTDEGITFGNDDDLLEVLDSLQVLRMVMDLEAKYGIKFDNSEMTPENLGSIAKLAAFVDTKR